MAAFFAVKEPFAICTCCRMAVRSSRASFLRSASASGVHGPQQSLRIATVISSIRASVDEGTAISYGMSILPSIQYIPERDEDVNLLPKTAKQGRTEILAAVDNPCNIFVQPSASGSRGGELNHSPRVV